ncbi:methylmalonyl Co-A mutase-associated GTPase MeaB [Solwaraspora sp. WMMD406]|uniref:methylmalonyl Co-A mutase-associated GTPase MeaB n=1 Tax=Solwaraspora sp. WMMD406 TaxID=3016095 RepID=UPI002416B062|nr:methylmalonyl Co-A mutase-associated GTPase MeaB [Solwaraspora sp. WMMD406]MDG4766026.1 methylmalonyl Co-A mutase-associated GTPase MeaB [Solwaraspora sp. WMMD406]
MTGSPRPSPAVADYVAGVRAGTPAWIARAITLVESTRPDHRARAQELLVALAPDAGRASRVGVTGVPGVGKSTFIDELGSRLIAAGHRVAVLAVDPSSTRTGGSILGDKTRMARLAASTAAFVRPSPTAGTLGGVARATREAMVVVEAAGYDVVLVETVGVGQSETAVAEMVDTFLLLTLARTGDQLQGIKKGVLELADVIVVNKADGTHADAARSAARELATALRMLGGAAEGWTTPVLTASGRDGSGLDEVWQRVTAHQDHLRTSGELARRRQRQQIRWMWSIVHDTLLDRLRTHPAVVALGPQVEARVLAGDSTAAQAAAELLGAFTGGHDGRTRS